MPPSPMTSPRYQIVIPMSGFGERFRRAGYTVPKPLIEIDGKPVIQHVVEMFPGETDFLFICNQEHLDNPSYAMRKTLERIAPTGKIVGIAPHKLGPVHAVLQAAAHIDAARPVVVNYCDFTCDWDWNHFKQFVAQCGCDGALPAYKGFHPHMLGTTNYAFMREEGGWVFDIQEKKPFTENRMEEYASSGSYYFKSGALMLDAFRETRAQQLQTGGEFYVSLVYKILFAEHKRVAVYPLQHFMQWGTPEDVAEYQSWSAAFAWLGNPQAALPPHTGGSIILPMAGLGQRFVDEGYRVTKPLIPVSGQPMVVQATRDLPAADHHAFVLRRDMLGHAEIAELLQHTFVDALTPTVEGVTQGQACTAMIGCEALAAHVPQGLAPLTFGACDNGMLYDGDALQALIEDPQVDVIVWVARGYANAIRNPQAYGWVQCDGQGVVEGVSVKIPLANPAQDPIILGTFTFKKPEDFTRCYQSLLARDGRVKGEFYLDSMVTDALALGLHCRIFEVDHYLNWGTPNDLRTFEYWQACFHQWPSHPYDIAYDRRVLPEDRAALIARYRIAPPSLPQERKTA